MSTHREPSSIAPRLGARASILLRASLLLTAAIVASSHGTAASAQAAPALWDATTSTVVVGPASGPGLVRVLRWIDGAELVSAFPFGETFSGGVSVAMGDIDGDAVPDVVVSTGPGGGFVSAHSGVDAHTIVSGYPYGTAFTQGLSVALGDVDGDRRADIIVGPSRGAGDVRVFRSADFLEIRAASPFGVADAGGVHLAAGDVDGDGRAEVIAGQASGGLVSVLSSADLSPLISAYPFGAVFGGGVSVATGDVNGDGRQDVVVAQAAGGAAVHAYSVADGTVLAAFNVVPVPLPDGLRVAAADLNGDGRADIIASAGPGGPPYVAAWDGNGLGLLRAYPVYSGAFAGGVAVAAAGAPSLRVTSADATTFTAGEAGSFTITTAGAPAGVTFTTIGTLPAGVTFTDRGDGTGTLQGTPAAPGVFPLTITAAHGTRIAAQAFTLTVTSVNRPPSFTAGPNQTVAEDAGVQTLTGWATNVNPGPSYESGQTVTFTVTGNTNAALFASLPAVAADGTLSYAPAPNANGTATISLVLRDDRGGADTSEPRTFTISVTPANDAPTFVGGANQQSPEDAGAQSVAGWATAISTGPANEASQTSTFVVTNNTNASLFSVGPSVSPTGTLTYTAAPNANGTATITVVLQDNGGTANGGVDTSAAHMFTITVTDDFAVVLEKTLTTAPANLDMPESYRLRISVPNTAVLGLNSVGPIVDTLPPGAVFNGASPAASCEPGCVGTSPSSVTWTSACTVPLAPGANCDIAVNVTFPSGTFPSGTNVTNTFSAQGTPAGEGLQNLGSAQTTHAVTTFVPSPGAAFAASVVGTPPALNETFSYQLSVGNNGNVVLDNLVIVDTVPVEMAVASVTTGAYSGLSDFAPGEGVRVSYEKNTAPGVFTLWGSSPNVTTNTTLTAPPPGLGVGEYLTRIRWEFGQAQPGMAAIATPRIGGQIVNPDNAGGPVAPGDTIQNCADLSAVFTAGPTMVNRSSCAPFVLGTQ